MTARNDADDAKDKGREQLREAMELFREAYQHQMRGDLEEAIALYTRSIEAFPTAEGYTFRGWTYSFLGRTEEAIAECMKAIEVDPTFGNPYNDIGAYLIEQERLDEAIPWFERALRAPRYESYCFPHFNLGRVYERKRQFARALECYRRALEENPRHLGARQAVGRLRGMFN
jgi:Tfp pilus assembly protein PilF